MMEYYSTYNPYYDGCEDFLNKFCEKFCEDLNYDLEMDDSERGYYREELEQKLADFIDCMFSEEKDEMYGNIRKYYGSDEEKMFGYFCDDVISGIELYDE